MKCYQGKFLNRSIIYSSLYILLIFYVYIGTLHSMTQIRTTFIEGLPSDITNSLQVFPWLVANSLQDYSSKIYPRD